MDERPLGLSLAVLVALAVLTASAQNFYPLRYGRRDLQADEGRFLRSFGARSDPSTGNSDLFYGTRYGKRSQNETTRPDISEFAAALTPRLEEVSPTKGRLGAEYPQMGISPRRNRFYTGSRFGKRGYQRSRSGANPYPSARTEEEPSNDKSSFVGENFYCRFAAFRRLHRCSDEREEVVV